MTTEHGFDCRCHLCLDGLPLQPNDPRRERFMTRIMSIDQLRKLVEELAHADEATVETLLRADYWVYYSRDVNQQPGPDFALEVNHGTWSLYTRQNPKWTVG